MVDLNKVEMLREKANITYEEARDVLLETDNDLLEAYILLEKRQQIPNSDPAEETVTFRTDANDGYNKEHESYHSTQKSRPDDHVSFGELVGRFFRFVGRLIHRGNINSFHVSRNEESIIDVPVTLLVILLILAFWIIFPLLIIGLFFGYSYRFSGPDLGRDDVNNKMHEVSGNLQKAAYNVKDAAGDFASDFKKGAGDNSDERRTEEQQDEHTTD